MKTKPFYYFVLSVFLLSACGDNRSADAPHSSNKAPIHLDHLTAASTSTPALNSLCQPIVQTTQIDEMVRQIVANLDDAQCLFAHNLDNVQAAWGFGKIPNMQTLLFPELNPKDPNYQEKLLAEMHKIQNNQRTIPADVLQKIEQHAAQIQNQHFIFQTGIGTTQSDGETARHYRHFTIAAISEYLNQNHGLSRELQNINALPAYLQERGQLFEAQSVFRIFNRARSADAPYLEIHFDSETGRIERITVYEKVPNPQSGIHLM